MAGAAKILLIEHDGLLVEALLEQFTDHTEFQLHVETTGIDGIARLTRESHIDVILLGRDLPDMSALDAARKIRENGFTFPIVMMIHAGETVPPDCAHDAIAKPFKFAALLERLRGQLRSHEQSEEAILSIGPFTFNPSAKLLMTEDGEVIKLTEKEASILKYLHRANGRPVSRDILLDEVWGYNSGVTTHTLETHVYRLRQKIEPKPGDNALLVTESGGYRLALEDFPAAR